MTDQDARLYQVVQRTGLVQPHRPRGLGQKLLDHRDGVGQRARGVLGHGRGHRDEGRQQDGSAPTWPLYGQAFTLQGIKESGAIGKAFVRIGMQGPGDGGSIVSRQKIQVRPALAARRGAAKRRGPGQHLLVDDRQAVLVGGGTHLAGADFRSGIAAVELAHG